MAGDWWTQIERIERKQFVRFIVHVSDRMMMTRRTTVNDKQKGQSSLRSYWNRWEFIFWYRQRSTSPSVSNHINRSVLHYQIDISIETIEFNSVFRQGTSMIVWNKCYSMFDKFFSCYIWCVHTIVHLRIQTNVLSLICRTSKCLAISQDFRSVRKTQWKTNMPPFKKFLLDFFHLLIDQFIITVAYSSHLAYS